MAKVVGPLYSMSASGKIANAMVFFGWKGKNVVRKWLKPSNPKSGAQGDVRLVMGGMGRSTRAIGLTSLFGVDAKAVAPSGQTFVSALISYILKNYMQNATAYEAEMTEYEAHTDKAEFDAAALSLGLVEFDISYKATTSAFVPGLQVYMLGKYGIAKRDISSSIFDRSPYDTAIADWTTTETGELVTDLTDI